MQTWPGPFAPGGGGSNFTESGKIYQYIPLVSPLLLVSPCPWQAPSLSMPHMPDQSQGRRIPVEATDLMTGDIAFWPIIAAGWRPFRREKNNSVLFPIFHKMAYFLLLCCCHFKMGGNKNFLFQLKSVLPWPPGVFPF
jgi:hypothetical protein